MAVRPLDDQHPDFGRKVGSVKTSGMTDYTLYANQFVTLWKAGPKNGIVTCSMDYPHGSPYPYIAGRCGFETFDDAANYAKTFARQEYDRALKIVKAYEK